MVLSTVMDASDNTHLRWIYSTRQARNGGTYTEFTLVDVHTLPQGVPTFRSRRAAMVAHYCSLKDPTSMTWLDLVHATA